jgi:hypothetical protein
MRRTIHEIENSVVYPAACGIKSSFCQRRGTTVPEPAEKENKKAARKARQAAQEEGGIIIEHEIPGVGGNEDEKLEQLYDQIAWPLGKKYGHPYDAFKLALTSVILYHLFTGASI